MHSSSQNACLPLRVVKDDIHGLQAHHGAVDAQRMLFIQRPWHICLHNSQECHVSVPVTGWLTESIKSAGGPEGLKYVL